MLGISSRQFNEIVRQIKSYNRLQVYMKWVLFRHPFKLLIYKKTKTSMGHYFFDSNIILIFIIFHLFAPDGEWQQIKSVWFNQ